jgi:hypothetical protein
MRARAKLIEIGTCKAGSFFPIAISTPIPIMIQDFIQRLDAGSRLHSN